MISRRSPTHGRFPILSPQWQTLFSLQQSCTCSVGGSGFYCLKSQTIARPESLLGGYPVAFWDTAPLSPTWVLKWGYA